MADEPALTELPSDLDQLMSLSAPELLSLTPEDWETYVTVVIAQQRAARASREAGIKPKRPAKTGGMKISLEALGLKQKPKPVEAGKGLRRL